MEREDLIDELLDLQHDLGKYILMPLSFLPSQASDDEVHAALRRALFETHKGPRGIRSARQIWTHFEANLGAELDERSSFAPLCAAVERALAWERAEPPIDREAARADLAAVMPAIRDLIDEVKRER
jgi:hypothetical protein